MIVSGNVTVRRKPKDGNGVSKVDIQYYLSTSNETPEGGEWSTDAPAWESGKYLWTRTVITYTDGTSTQTDPVCITGSEGKGVSEIVEQYYLSDSPTELEGGMWTESPPAWEQGKYMWTRSVITYTDGTQTTTKAVCVSGSKGADGQDGKDGQSVTVSGQSITYAVSSSGTTAPTVFPWAVTCGARRW